MNDSEQAKSRMPWVLATLFATGAFFIGIIGIGWGTPSMERNALYFSVSPNLPAIPPEIVEQSWKHFPEFGWLEENKNPDNLQGAIKRSLFNPVRSYHPDEYVILKTLANMHPARLDFDPKFYAWPSFLTYLVGIALKLASLTGLVHLTTDLQNYFRHPEEIARMYVVGRAVVALFGAAAVVLIYLAGRKTGGEVCGVIAAAALSASPAFVINAHYMTADLPMLCFAVATILLCLGLAERPSRGLYVAAGLCAGLCAGMKYTGAAVLFPLLYTHGTAWFRGRGARHGWLLLALLAAAAAFCIVNPFHVLRLPKVLQILSWESEYVQGQEAQTPRLLIPLAALRCGLGGIVPVVAILGAVRFISARERPDLIAASGIVIYLATARVSSPFLRHYLILVPFVILLAARCVAEAGRWFCSSRGRSRAVVLGALLLIAPGLPTSVRALSLFASENVRTEGGRRVVEYVPKGAKVAVVSEPWQFDSLPMDLQRYRIVVTGYDAEKVLAERPDWFVGTGLQFQTLYGFEDPTGDMKRFRTEVLENDQIASRVSFPGYSRGFCRRCPQDMRYVCPDILLYKFHWTEGK